MWPKVIRNEDGSEDFNACFKHKETPSLGQKRHVLLMVYHSCFKSITSYRESKAKNDSETKKCSTDFLKVKLNTV